MLDGDGVGIPYPDADGAVLTGVYRAIVPGAAVFNHAAVEVGQHDAVADVTSRSSVSGMIIHGAVSDVDVIVRVVAALGRKPAVNFDTAVAKDTEVGMGAADVAKPAGAPPAADGDAELAE